MAIVDEVQRLARPLSRWARTQKREYTDGEERPLAGDLGAMGVYVGLVSAAVRKPGFVSRIRIGPVTSRVSPCPAQLTGP